jgi:indoleamine 2,3-dioxygenase
LPCADPLRRLAGSEHAPWEEALSELPKLLLTGRVRHTVESLPAFDAAPLLAAGGGDARALWRAQLLLSFLSHAYVWGELDGAPPRALPARLAVPWCAVSSALDVPPVMTYATYNLLNWRRMDASAPVELGNLVCLHNFSGGQDEEWFRVVHVAIEARAGDALARLADAQAAAAVGDADATHAGLVRIADALRGMRSILARMTERCDPSIYYNRVRWPMAGWRGNDALPHGLLYEGVGDTAPRQYYGETGAQSSVVPAFDAALGIEHGGMMDAAAAAADASKSAWLSAYLRDMRAHMPREHRAFLAAREAEPSLRGAALASGAGSALRGAYDDAVAELTAFRGQHKAFAASYIAQHARRASGEKGTGGSDFMPALAGYQSSTARAALGASPHA